MSSIDVVDTGGRVDQDATARFDEFVAARSRALLRTAYLLTHDHALAEDLLQTALTKAWFAWRRIDGDPEPYVRRILVNTYASWWRRQVERRTPHRGAARARDRTRRAPTRPISGRPWSGSRDVSARSWSCATSRT